MQAPGQAGRNWIAGGIVLQQMQWNTEDECVCVRRRREEEVLVIHAIRVLLFLWELIRRADNSLLGFHLNNKPLEAVACSDLELLNMM